MEGMFKVWKAEQASLHALISSWDFVLCKNFFLPNSMKQPYKTAIGLVVSDLPDINNKRTFCGTL